MENTGISRFTNAIKFFRETINSDLPIQQIELLLVVAEKEGTTMPELMQRLKMPQGTLSRHVKKLSIFLRDDKKIHLAWSRMVTSCFLPGQI